MRRLNAYAAVVAGVFSAAVVAAAGITVWALRHRNHKEPILITNGRHREHQ